MFGHLKQPMDVTQYTLMRGVTDFGNLKQYDLYETGYPFLIVVDYPRFLETLKTQNEDYRSLIENYIHILEYEFRGLDGLDNITADTSELTNGINSLNLITKVNEQANGTFTMRYWEKSGSTITRVHKLFLTGIKDPRTQIKTYHGLIDRGAILNPGFHNEVFTFLYFVTDNTMAKVEAAYLIIAAQPTTAEVNIYNVEKGTMEFKELSVEFTGFPYTSAKVNEAAQNILEWINGFGYTYDAGGKVQYNQTIGGGNQRMYRSSDNFDYTAYPNKVSAASKTEKGIVSNVFANYTEAAGADDGPMSTIVSNIDQAPAQADKDFYGTSASD